MKRLGILISGRGSNFEAIANAVAVGTIDAEIAVVIANRPEAAAAGQQVDLVCLAGFMRLLSASFIRQFPNRILNIHPSLLPAFPGLDAQHQALEHGVKITGCTVHFVDEFLDAGPIVVQAAVPVLDRDSVESLSDRILKEEHRIYPEAIRIVLSGHYATEGRRVILS